jgi:LuxR family maltose regulon positive regulatory protein
VLDDYHLIDSSDVDAALAFVLEHRPSRLHVVISTRQDPDLQLARLRARGQLVELRAEDLRLTPSEAAAFLNSVMDLRLSARDIATLESRTEGWVAGLQLAALSMRGHADVSGFIQAFAGDHRYIADYLVGEVLGRQPEDMRSFLLQTAVLDRMCGPLCDAVTRQANGSARLEVLERGNFFVVPLDDKRQWYRYHHLFAEVLRAYLTEEQPDAVAGLHRRASAWYESAGSLGDAIRHSLAAEDFEHVANLVEQAGPAMLQLRHEATALGWLRALPDEVFDRRPVLSAIYAATLLVSGETAGAGARLAAAERWVEPSPGTTAARSDMVVANEDAFRTLPGSLAVWRAGLALAHGQVADTVRHATRALGLTADDDHLSRGSAAALLGLVAWGRGDLDEAYRMYAECMRRLELAGSFADVVGCAIAVADLRIAQGRLRDAEAVYQSALGLATSREPVLRGAADMHVGLSALHREHGDIDAAKHALASSEALGEGAGLRQNRYRSRVAAARISEAEGDLAGAVALLIEAERVFTTDFLPNVRPLAAMKARVWIAQGNVDRAAGWAREHAVSADDELSYLREYEHITLARLLLARGSCGDADARDVDAARHLLDRLLRAADEGHRTGVVIELLVLLAVAYRAQGAVPAALDALERALALAEPEGYFRLFADEGAPVEALLEVIAKRGRARGYARELLRAFRQPSNAMGQSRLIEPLSERELEVLRLLRTDLDGPDIARQLVVSLNTMRTHTKNIYSKLGVSNRRAAVRRAEELQLLSSHRG